MENRTFVFNKFLRKTHKPSYRILSNNNICKVPRLSTGRNKKTRFQTEIEEIKKKFDSYQAINNQDINKFLQTNYHQFQTQYIDFSIFSNSMINEEKKNSFQQKENMKKQRNQQILIHKQGKHKNNYFRRIFLKIQTQRKNKVSSQKHSKSNSKQNQRKTLFPLQKQRFSLNTEPKQHLQVVYSSLQKKKPQKNYLKNYNLTQISSNNKSHEKINQNKPKQFNQNKFIKNQFFLHRFDFNKQPLKRIPLLPRQNKIKDQIKRSDVRISKIQQNDEEFLQPKNINNESVFIYQKRKLKSNKMKLKFRNQN